MNFCSKLQQLSSHHHIEECVISLVHFVILEILSLYYVYNQPNLEINIINYKTSLFLGPSHLQVL
jgi:hypothetical protein